VSQENVDLVHQVFDAFNRRDLDAVLALMDDDVEGSPRMAAIEGAYHGHEGMRRWWRNLLDSFPDFTAEVGEVRDLGDLTITAVRLRGQGAGSDTPIEQAVWNVFRWRRGKCIWWRNCTTEEEALKAVGLEE
jgi:ketosteroid isomerase-like protein